MTDWLGRFFGANVYLEHQLCLLGDQVLLWAYTVSDLTIWLSYMTIGVTLVFYRLKPDIHRSLSFSLFAAFIILCGLTHLTETLTLFSGVYRLDVMVRIATAAVSAVTAGFMLFGSRGAA